MKTKNKVLLSLLLAILLLGMFFLRDTLSFGGLQSSVSNIVSDTSHDTSYFHILSTGQSLSVGGGSLPALSSSQPYNNLMLGGSVMRTEGELGALREVSVETPSSGIANSLQAYDNILERPVIVGLHGIGGKSYAGIKKGGTEAAYANGQLQASATKRAVEALGGKYTPLAVTLHHGEADEDGRKGQEYAGYLREFQSDYQSDMRSLTGDSTLRLPLFFSQMNSRLQSNTSLHIPLAQLQAHTENPGNVILVGPKYQYSYLTDHTHLTNIDSRHSGEMFAKVIKKVMIDGETWNPLMPKSIVRVGRVITVDYHIPVGSLQLDTTHVAQRHNYGFEFVQTGGTSTLIQEVKLINNNTQIQITLDKEPDGTNQKLRYALSCITGFPRTCGGAQQAGYYGGNVRDSDTSVSPASDSTQIPLYNWSVAFEESISALNIYTITFDKNDTLATGTMANQIIASGASANLTTNGYAKTGFTFAGWATTAGGAVVYANSASYTMGAANVTLYAKWTQDQIPLTSIGAITGTQQVGSTLTAGAILPAGATATYQWKVSNTAIGTYINIQGATSSTYTPVASNEGKFIRVGATGTGNYSGPVISVPTDAITGAAVNGICGAAAKSYTSADTDYGTLTFCSPSGSVPAPLNPAFPGAGASVTWACSGVNGGNPSGTCTATKTAAPVNGVCGSAAATCTAGTLNQQPADTTTQYLWTCEGTNGGTDASCNAPITDTTAPTVTAFNIPSTVTSLTVPITTLTASEAGVSYYLIDMPNSDNGVVAPTAPSATVSGWISSKPTTHIFSSSGFRILFVWVKDTAGNVSRVPAADAVTITLTTPINGVCGAAAKTYASTVTSYGSDNQCATGNPSNTAFPAVGASVTWTCSGTNGGTPSATCTASRANPATTYPVTYDDNSATGGSIPVAQTKIHGTALTLATNSGNLTKTGYTFAGWNTTIDGTGTSYAAGASYTANAQVILYAKWTIIPDTTAPTVTAFTLPATATSLTVPITTFTASEKNVYYIIQEGPGTPPANSLGWTSSKPERVLVSAPAGSKTLYAWVKDAAGNISNSLSDTVVIDTTAPAAPTPIIPIQANITVSTTTQGTTYTATGSSMIINAPCAAGERADVYQSLTSTSLANANCVNNLATLTLNLPTQQGFIDYVVKLTDAAGNVSQASVIIRVFKVVTSNAPGIPDLVLLSDLGTSSTDNLTSETRPQFTLSCISGSVVNLYDGTNTTPIGTGSCVANTTQIPVTQPLSDGPHSITAKQIVDGTTSAASGVLSLTIDTVPLNVAFFRPGGAGAPAGVADNTSTSPTITFAATFSRPIDVTSFIPSDVNVTNGTCTSVTPLSGNTYTVTVSATSQGVVRVSLIPGKVQTLSGKQNTESTGTNSVTYGTVTCTDSDGGKDYFVKGVTTGLARCVDQSNCLIPTTAYDICGKDANVGGTDQTTNSLQEFICEDGYKSVNFYECPNGCSNGACITTSTTTAECSTLLSFKTSNPRSSSLDDENLCKKGTPGAVSYSSSRKEWSYECRGSNSTRASCTVKAIIEDKPKTCEAKELPFDECTLKNTSNLYYFYEYLDCLGVAEQSSCNRSYGCPEEAKRQELVYIADQLRGITLDENNYECQGNHTDTERGVEDWVCEAAEKAQIAELISATNTKFRPKDTITRAEAYSVLMKSICVHPDTDYRNWQTKVAEEAKDLGFTVRTVSKFEPNKLILRQELYALAARIAEYKNENGDECDDLPDELICEE